MSTRIISHRGRTSLGGLDNTLQSINHAISVGVDMVEFDVRRTKDGQLLCFHDSQIDSKRLCDLHYAEVIEINSMIPTLEQVLWTASEKIKVDIELKESSYEEEVVTMVRRYFGYDNFTIKSFQGSVVEKIKQLDKEIFTGLLIGQGYSLFNFLKVLKECLTFQDYYSSKVDYISFHYKIFEMGLSTKFRNMGIPIQLWTVNDPLLLNKIMEENLHSVVTDVPEIAMNLRENLTND